MSNGRWFEVVSAEYGQVVAVLDFGEGPIEYERDFLYVRAKNAKRAKSLMVRAWRRRLGSSAWRHSWLTDGNPFAGMRVVPSLPEKQR